MKLDFNFLDFFKLPTKIMASIAIASGLILFMPDIIINKMFLATFRNSYGFIIGLVFLITFSLLAVSLVISIYKYFLSRRAKKKFLEEANNKLRKLDTYQKAMVYYLYSEDNHTGELPLHDGAVKILEYNYIIGKATTQYLVEDLNNAVFPYMLQPWVIDEFQKDSELESLFEKAVKDQVAKEKANLHGNNSWYDN